jgi:hypothetical protein
MRTENIDMIARGRAYQCVGGPYDASVLCILGDDKRVRLPTPSLAQNAASDTVADAQTTEYRVMRLLDRDGDWHEFLVSSSLTTMQATVWLNRR